MIAGIGVDPGPSTGITAISWGCGEWQVHSFQCTHSSAPWLLTSMIDFIQPRFVAVEEFETRRGSGGTTGKDADITKGLRYEAEQIVRNLGLPVYIQTPSQVKPWATDKRLEKIGFPLGAKFKDARDSARHSLFCGTKLSLWPDPLSRR